MDGTSQTVRFAEHGAGQKRRRSRAQGCPGPQGRVAGVEGALQDAGGPGRGSGRNRAGLPAGREDRQCWPGAPVVLLPQGAQQERQGEAGGGLRRRPRPGLAEVRCGGGLTSLNCGLAGVFCHKQLREDFQSPWKNTAVLHFWSTTRFRRTTWRCTWGTALRFTPCLLSREQQRPRRAQRRGPTWWVSALASAAYAGGGAARRRYQVN